MKYIFLIPAFLLMICSSSNSKDEENVIEQNNETMDTDKLLVNLVLKRKERSKDSNSSTITVKISEEKILIDKHYGGFKAPKDEKIKKKLGKGQKKQIFNFIQERKLNVNIEEVKKTEGIGVEGHLLFEIYQPDTTVISISGKTNIWGGDDYVKKEWGKKFVESRTNIENIEYFEKARSFVRFVEGL